MSPNAARDKGLRAEREAARLLEAELGYPMHRLTSPGSPFEVGDLFGLPDCVVQVAYWPSNTLAAYVKKPDEAEAQRLTAGVEHAVSMIRHKGGLWRVAMTVPQFARLYREHR